jgi:3-oxoacyl-[acyl-carrier-protein] synthase-3
MAGGKLAGVRVSGVGCAVPEKIKTTDDLAEVFGEEHARKLQKSTGVVQSHVSADAICSSDLCFFAGEKLLDELGWERSSVDVLAFVSVTRDYVSPATACRLQHRLRLGKGCAAFDITHTCSGYIYGLWLVSHLLSGGGAKRALLLVGDTSSRYCSPYDRAVAGLVGDAGSATALERNESAEPMYFELGTDGSGIEAIIVKAGAFRHPSTTETRMRTEREGGNSRSDEDLFMNGPEVFSFTLREVPPLYSRVLELAGWTLDDVQAVIMHQANLFIIRHLAKKLGVPSEKSIENLARYGNTSGASIPLALTQQMAERLRNHSERLVLLGFGAGLSWGGAALTCGPLVIPELTTVSPDDLERSIP